MKQQDFLFITEKIMEKLFDNEKGCYFVADFANALFAEKENLKLKIISFKDKLSGYENDTILTFEGELDNGKNIIISLFRITQDYYEQRTLYNSMLVTQNAFAKYFYNIAFSDFKYTKASNYISRLQFINIAHKQSIFDNFKIFTIEFPKFDKTEQQLENKLDKWIYLIKNIDKLSKLPQNMNEQIFKDAFEILKS